MNTLAPAVLNIFEVLEAAYDVADEDPAYFGLWISQAYADPEAAEWHTQDPDGVYWHHASALGECLRRHVLERSGAEKEPHMLASRTAFSVGRFMHVLLQLGMAVHPDCELLGHEIGGRYEGLRLAAHSDGVYRWQAGPVGILDLKSERDHAQGYREKEAAAQGRSHTAKPEHVLQLQATAEVVSQLCGIYPTEGMIVYWAKGSNRLDPQPVPLDSYVPVRKAVARREDAFADRMLWGTLPPVLDTFPNAGLCKARGANDPRGVWCAYRSACAKEAAA